MTADLDFATVLARVNAAGFPQAAVLNPIPSDLDPRYLDQLLTDGVGDMGYLARHRDLRLNPAHLLPGAQSMLMVLLAYDPAPESAPDGSLRRARYAAGKDYHGLLRKRLATLAKDLEAACPHSPGSGQWRATVDSAPINERSLAHYAGLGWIGRNALLLTPRRGSYQHIGALLTTRHLAPGSPNHNTDHCGRCTACEDRCPTQALVERRVTSTKCISYLTIEHFGVIPRDLAQHFEGWWFGCDLCQAVCPWNRFAPISEDQRLSGNDEPLEDLMAITADTFDAHFAGRAIRRIGYERFRRNLMVATWSLGQFDTARSLIDSQSVLLVDQAHELGLISTKRITSV